MIENLHWFQPIRTLQVAGMTLLLSLLAAGPICAAEEENGDPSFLEQVVDAIRNWFNNQSESPANPGDAPNQETPVPSPEAPRPSHSPVASGTPAADNLARLIASEAGGHADQYQRYAEKLATTLAQLSPEQQARVLRR